MKFNRVKVRKPLSYKQQMTPKHIAKYLEKLEKLKEKIKNSWGDEALPNPSFTYRKFLWLPKSFEVFSDRIGNVREVRWLCFANIRCRVYYQTIKVVKFPKLKRFLNRYFFTKFETFGLLEYDETKIQTKDIGFEDYYTYKTVLKNYKEEEYEQGNNRVDRIEEADELRTALDGFKYKMFIWELDQKLRSVHKYGNAIEGTGEATPEEMDVCYRLREYIRQELQDSNLTIE